jgi:hypothetical protein
MSRRPQTCPFEHPEVEVQVAPMQKPSVAVFVLGFQHVSPAAQGLPALQTLEDVGISGCASMLVFAPYAMAMTLNEASN